MYKLTVLPPNFAKTRVGSRLCSFFQPGAAGEPPPPFPSPRGAHTYFPWAWSLNPAHRHTHLARVSAPADLNVRLFEVTCSLLGRLSSQPGRPCAARGQQGRGMTTGKPTGLRAQSCRVRLSVALRSAVLGFPTYYTRLAVATKGRRGPRPAGFRLLGPPCEGLLLISLWQVFE